MKSGRSSLDLTGSPYLPAKTKSSQTPLKAKNISASRHSISIPKTAIYSSSKRQSTHSPLRSNLHHDERVSKTPIKNQSVKNVPRTHENVRVMKDTHTYKNTSSSLNKGMIKGGIEDKEIKKNNYIYVSDELKASNLVKSPDSKDLQSDNIKTDKLPQNPDGKTDTDKTKIILFDDQQVPQQEQNDELNQRADVSKLVKSKTQTIGTEKTREKVVKKFGFCKEGYLMKRPLLPFGWERVYFLAGDLKLYYAPSQELFETKTNVKCLNLLSNICEVIDEKGQEFSIAARGLGSVLSLKANSVEEANEWILFLKTLFIFAHQTVVESNKKYIPSHEVFHKSDVILEEEFLATLDTGDVLLLHGGHFAAKMQRIFTVSEYDHLALIMRNKDEIFLFDSTTEYGVQLLSWKDFKQDKHYLSYPTMAYRKLNIKDESLKDEVKQKLWEFVTLQVGKKYELGFKKLFRKPSFDENENEHNKTSDLNTTLEVGVSHEHKDMKNARSVNTIKTPSLTSLYRDSDEGFFCSELVAAAYKFAGLLDATISSTRYLPVSFSQRRELVMLMGCTLSNEYDLALLNEHEPIVPK